MRILYATGLSLNDSSLYRPWGLEGLEHTVIPFENESSNELIRKIACRLSAGPGVERRNSDLLQIAEVERPDMLSADELLSMKPKTLEKLRAMGIYTLSPMIDNAFGPHRAPDFRLYMKSIPHYDLHVVQRDKNISDYRQRGARDVLKIQTAYEPTIHFPPPKDWSDANRDRDVSFIGTPYDQRDGYHNDRQLSLIAEKVQQSYPAEPLCRRPSARRQDVTLKPSPIDGRFTLSAKRAGVARPGGR
jgi:spore maturation protein CgeB